MYNHVQKGIEFPVICHPFCSAVNVTLKEFLLISHSQRLNGIRPFINNVRVVKNSTRINSVAREITMLTLCWLLDFYCSHTFRTLPPADFRMPGLHVFLTKNTHNNAPVEIIIIIFKKFDSNNSVTMICIEPGFRCSEKN